MNIWMGNKWLIETNYCCKSCIAHMHVSMLDLMFFLLVILINYGINIVFYAL